MSICLSHRSADVFLEHLAHKGGAPDNLLQPASGSALAAFTSNIEEARSLLGEDLNELRPVDLLVGNPNAMRSGDEVSAHLWTGNLPDGFIKQYREGIYVVSPELCLLQQTNELHLVNLCQMLGRFMATASPVKADDGAYKLKERSPIISKTELEDRLMELGKVRGVRALREALRYTLPGAASPQETNLQLAMTLPYAYYGFGFKNLELNHQIALGETAQELCNKSHLYIDLYFGKPRARKGEDPDAIRAFGLEYQGEDFHQDPSSDASRFLAAHLEGVDLWYVAKAQLDDAKQLDYIAREAARRIRRRCVESTWPEQEELEILLDILNGKKVPHPGECRRKRASMAREQPTRHEL